MSLFFQSDSQLQSSLDKLPDSYSNEEILSMYNHLQTDLQATSHGAFDNLAAKVMHYSEKHKKFCLSFPMLFRCTVKGSFTPEMLKVFLATRHKLEKGEVGEDHAKNILVDAGVSHIKTRDAYLS